MSSNPGRPSDGKVVDELVNVFDQENDARALLERLRFPRGQIPQWTTPATFWQSIARRLGDGVMENVADIRPVVASAAEIYPGNRTFSAWLRPEPEAAPQAQVPAQRQPHIVDGSSILLNTVTNIHELIDTARSLALTRGVPGPVNPIYASGPNVMLDLPGASFEEAMRLSNALVGALNGYLHGTPRVATNHVRDYLIGRLLVEGPDAARFELNGVAASTPVRDIARAVMDQYDEKMWPRDRDGKGRPSVINHVELDGTSRRLNPEKTLQDEGIGENATLRVAPESRAGAAIDANTRDDALARVRNQILDYADAHPGFEVHPNAILFPTEYDIRFRVPSWGPPPTLRADPVPIEEHEVLIVLPPDFPIRAPEVYWKTPIFHPNIHPKEPHPVCLGVLADHYRPGLDFELLCQKLVDIAGYLDYEARDAVYSLEARAWALSVEGQILIESRGGQSVTSMLHELKIQETQDPLPLRIKRCES